MQDISRALGFLRPDSIEGAFYKGSTVSASGHLEGIMENRVIHDNSRICADESHESATNGIRVSDACKGKEKIQKDSWFPDGNFSIRDEHLGQCVIEGRVAERGPLQARIFRGEGRLNRLEVEGSIAGLGVELVDIAHAFDTLSLFDCCPLRLHSPEHVTTREISLVGIIGRALGIDPVNSSVLLIPVGSDIGVALSPFGVQPGGPLIRGRVVLNHDIVPVTDPERSIGTNFGTNWSGPSISRIINVIGLLL